MADRTSLTDILNIPDPLYSDNFELLIPVLPAGIGDSRGLQIQCKTASLPGIQNEAQDLMLHGFKTSVAGRTVFTNTLAATFVESRTLNIYTALKAWVNVVRDYRTQKSVGKKKYSTTGYLTVFDETGVAINTYALGNLWCAEVQDVNLDGSAANIIEISTTFRYDYADVDRK